MKKVFVHVGLHKTASTWFQGKIFPFLKNTQLISRPFSSQGDLFNKLQFANEPFYNSSQFKNDLLSILDPQKNLLISDENLSGYPYFGYCNRSQIANRLQEVFPDAEIILFIRGQTSMIRSLYNQSIKTGWGTGELHDFIWKQKRTYTWSDYSSGIRNYDLEYRHFNHTIPLNIEAFFYHELVQLYKEKFKKVHVFLYEDFRVNPSKVAHKIFSILEDYLDRDIDFRPVNLKADAKEVEKLLIKNKLSALKPQTSLSRKIIKAALTVSSKIDKASSSGDRRNKIDLASFYSENNRKLLSAFPRLGIERYPKDYVT